MFGALWARLKVMVKAMHRINLDTIFVKIIIQQFKRIDSQIQNPYTSDGSADVLLLTHSLKLDNNLILFLNVFRLINKCYLMSQDYSQQIRTAPESCLHIQDSNNANCQELPLFIHRDEESEVLEQKHNKIASIIYGLYRKQMLKALTRWININWRKLQLLTVLLMGLILIAGVFIIYQSYRLPPLQFLQDISADSAEQYRASRFHSEQLYNYNHHAINPKTDEMQKKQLQQKQLKILRLEKSMIDLGKRITRSERQYSKLTKIHQKMHPDKKTYSISKTAAVGDPKQDLKYIKKVVNEQKIPHFPKIVWMYVEENVTVESNLTQTLIANIEQYLLTNGYQFYIISDDNFNFIMNNRNQEQLGFVLADLWHKAYESKEPANLPDHVLNIKKQLINLIMLSESGGILIDKEVILTQDLSWLQNLDKISYMNKGRSALPNVVGFHYRNYTSPPQKVAISEYQDREIHLYPSLDPYFLAVSKQGCEFIKLVLQKYYLLIQNYDKVKPLMGEYQLDMFQISGNDPYFQSYYIAFTMVLKQKQMQFDLKWLQNDRQGFRELALDYYGIYSINRLYGPLRYRLLFSDQSYEDIYFTFSKIQNAELIRYYGDIELMTFIPFQYGMAEYLEQAQAGNDKYAILKNSFFHRYVYTNYTEADFIIESLTNFPERIPLPNPVIWKSLPRIIWIYLQKDISRNIIQRLCLHSIKNSALQSGFQLNIITDANIESYIGKDALDDIDEIAFSRYIDYPEIRNELIELTILKDYGGIWIQLPLFTIQNFNWLLNIHKNAFAINKVGKLPKVLLFYHPIFSKFQWKVNNDSSVELNQRLSYMKSFIAAQQKSELITLWLAELRLNFQMGTYQLEEKFIVEYKVPAFDISKDQKEIFKYSLSYILENEGKKYNTRLNGREVTMAQKCGLWILNGFIGSEKLKEFTNYEKGYNHNNIYLWSHSQNYVSSLLGQFHYFVSLNGQEQSFLNYELGIREPNTPDIKIHSNSIFYNYLYNPKVIEEIFSNVSSSEMAGIQELNQHIPSDIWLYVEGRSIETETYLKRCVNNILWYSQGYTVHYITNENVKDFVTVELRDSVKTLLEEIDKMTSYSPENIYEIKKRIIILSILAQKGGVFIDSNIILTEPLDWIDKINKNVFVNGGYNTVNKVVGFFAINSHSQLIKHSQIEQITNPILQPFFIAAFKNTTFIKDLFSQYLTTVRQQHIQLAKRFTNNTNSIKNVQQIELFYVASNITLQGKQLANKEHLVTDYYGLSLINSRYFPKKLEYIYADGQIQSLFNSMGLISEKQLAAYIGPLSYMVKIPKAEQIYIMIDSRNIKKSSLLSNHLFLDEEDKHIEHSLLRKMDFNTVWEELPKTIWYYETMVLSEDYINTKIKTKVFQMANAAGLNLIEVTAKTIKNYTKANNTVSVDAIIPKIKVGLDREGIIEFIHKLQLLDQYGGIILPTNFVPVDNFNWMVNLSQINGEFIYNRYGKKPKVLTFFRQTPHHLYNYTIDENYGIKVSSNLTILTNFIAAVKDSEFVRQLLAQFIRFIALSDKQISNILNEYHLHIDSKKAQLQEFVSCIVNYVLLRKEKQLKSQEGKVTNFQYYGIWSMNEDVGPNKWLADLNTNSGEEEATKLKLWFSVNSDYVNRVVGKPNYFLSLNAKNKKRLSQMVFEEEARRLQLSKLYSLQFDQ